VGELVVRFVGGVHALFGLGLLVAGVGALAGQAPETTFEWVTVVLGGLLVAVMAVTGLRLALGEPVSPLRAAGLIVVTLLGGLVGAGWMLVVASDIGR
jgi:hypothetical protein